jgi:hypothetical protein
LYDSLFGGFFYLCRRAAWAAAAAGWFGGHFAIIVNRCGRNISRNRWWQHSQIKRQRRRRIFVCPGCCILTLIGAFAAGRAFTIAAALVAITAFISVIARRAITLRGLLALLAFIAFGHIARITLILIVHLAPARLIAKTFIIIIITLPIITAGLVPIFFKTRAIFRDDPEIVIGKLQIIFGHHTITLHLRFAGKVLVLFKKLRRIAAGAVIDATAIVGATTALIATTAPTAAGLPVIDQVK